MGAGDQRFDIWNKGLSFWLACALILATYALLRIHLVAIPLDRDEGIFGYAGQVILDHGLPYRDVFEHKPPAAYYINALALLLVPPTPTGIHLFLHAYNVLTTIVLFLVSRTFFRSDSAGLWTAFAYSVMSSTPGIQGFTASTEMFMLLPISLSMLFAVLGADRRMRRFPLLSGAAAAVACWTKPTAAFSVLFIGLYAAGAAMLPREGEGKASAGRAAGTAASWIAGAVGVSAVLCGYFLSKGIFGEFYYWSFVHSSLYGKGVGLFGSVPNVFRHLLRISYENAPIVLAAVAGCLLDLVRRDKSGFFTLGFLVFSAMGTVPGFAYPHYFAQIAPAAAIAAGRGIFMLQGVIPGKIGKIAAAAAIAAAIVATPVATRSDIYLETSPDRISRKIFGLNPFPESVVLADYIASRTAPGDTVFIFGSEAQIFLYSRRKSATPYALIYPLMSSYPRYREFQERAWNEIRSRPPAYILVTLLPTSLLWDGAADVAIYRNVMELVREKYAPEGVMIIGGERGYFVSPDQAARSIPGGYAPSITVYRRRS